MTTHPQSTKRLLLVTASARGADSVSRALSEELLTTLAERLGPLEIQRRDLTQAPPLVDADWIAANFTPAEQRTKAQCARLSVSDSFVEELKAADLLVIATPIYNFGVPAALKAWIDMVARARVTFRYTEQGPRGLLENKAAHLVVTSGGTPIGSDIDFATGYLRHVLAFLGITDVNIIAADQLNSRGRDVLASARRQIAQLGAAAAA